jgi:uncharacterized protein YjiS (DUF1127 family)
MSTYPLTHRPLSRPIATLRPRLRAPLHILTAWVARGAERRALRQLAEDRHLLRDIGLTREQALREAEKPFWRR